MNSKLFVNSIVILCVLLIASATWVKAGKLTLGQLLDQEKAEDRTNERALIEKENEKLLEELTKRRGGDLFSLFGLRDEILDPTKSCRTATFITNEDRHHFYLNCDECCDHLGNGAWQENKEKTSVGSCICKPRTHVNLCNHERESNECQACCDSYSYKELIFIYDEEISFKGDNGCKCKVRFLAPPKIH